MLLNTSDLKTEEYLANNKDNLTPQQNLNPGVLIGTY